MKSIGCAAKLRIPERDRKTPTRQTQQVVGVGEHPTASTAGKRPSQCFRPTRTKPCSDTNHHLAKNALGPHIPAGRKGGDRTQSGRNSKHPHGEANSCPPPEFRHQNPRGRQGGKPTAYEPTPTCRRKDSRFNSPDFANLRQYQRESHAGTAERIGTVSPTSTPPIGS